MLSQTRPGILIQDIGRVMISAGYHQLVRHAGDHLQRQFLLQICVQIELTGLSERMLV